VTPVPTRQSPTATPRSYTGVADLGAGVSLRSPPINPPPHHIETLSRNGAVRDRADVARRLGLTHRRITQLLDLTLLAPDIQEEVLSAEAIDGREPFTERDARRVALVAEWPKQREAWRAVTRRGAP
jgi:hypothetical protein